MAENSVASLDVTSIDIAVICGLWEVIRISRDNNHPVYPWINGRFKFYFLDEMMFSLLKDGLQSQGTWELVEKDFEAKKYFSIILDGQFEYGIINIDDDEMILSDHLNKFLLVKKL